MAAAAAIGVWVLLLGLFALITRPRDVEPGPATMELGEEPPAVVDYITNGYKVTNHGVAGTLLDLAAGHFLDIDQQPAGTYFSVGREAPDRLMPHERMLYDHVARLAGDKMVPAQALTIGSDARATSWLRRFDRLVAEYSKSHGLTVPRFGFKEWGIVRLAGLVAALLVIGASAQANAIELGIVACGMGLVGSQAALQKVFGSQKLTPAGAQAVAHWLGVKEYLSQGEGFHELPAAHVILWDRYMAYAAALGLARAAARALPLGADDDNHAWSDYTGTWRQVSVVYPRRRFLWGRSPWNVMLIGLGMVVFGGGGVYYGIKFLDTVDSFYMGTDARDWVYQGTLVAIGLFGFVVFWGLTTMNLAYIDFGRKRAQEGLVVRCRSFSAGENKTDYFIAVDDGKQSEIKAWVVPWSTYTLVSERARVSATVTKCQGHVLQLNVTQAGPAPEPVDAAEVPPVQMVELPHWLDGLIASAQAGPPATDPASLVTLEELATAVGEPVTQEHVGDALAFGPMRAVRYKSASGASIDIRVAGGAFASMFKSIASRWTAQETIGGMGAVLNENSVLLMGNDGAVIIQIEGGRLADRHDAVRRVATVAASRLHAAAPGVTTT
jgi:hypothetical protein